MNKNWSALNGVHIPKPLTREGVEELRLIGLYPNAADLLATVDHLLPDAERFRWLMANPKKFCMIAAESLVDSPEHVLASIDEAMCP